MRFPGTWKPNRPTAIAVAAVIGVLGLVAAFLTAPRVLSRLEYFRLTKVEFDGVRFTSPSELRALIPADTTWSVWDDLDTIAKAISSHEMVASARTERRLPGTVIVHVTERIPVALVQQPDGYLVPMSADSKELRMSAARVPLDLPVALAKDSVILRVLGALMEEAPALFDRIVLVRRTAPGQLAFEVGNVTIRTRDDVTTDRFLDILPVEEDVTRNGLRVVEYDLRFKNQVIVRQP